MAGNNYDWNRDTESVIKKYFDQPKILVQHQLESYNNTVETVIPSIINHQNPIQIPGQWNPTTKRFERMYEIRFKDVYMCRPLIRDDHETIKPLYPQEARLRNLTYSAPIFVDLEQRLLNICDPENPAVIDEGIEKKVPLCNFPVMLQSNYCHLADAEPKDLPELGENLYDIGGYFVINGSEKVIIPQERPAENKVLCFQRKGELDIVEVKSTIDQRFNPVNNISIALNRPKDEADRLMTVNMKSVTQPINLFVIFRALGIETDYQILQMILGFTDQNQTEPNLPPDIQDPNQTIETQEEDLNLLLPTAYETFKTGKTEYQITNQMQALRYIASQMKINQDYVKQQINRTGTNMTYEQAQEAQENYMIKYVREILARDFLPHVGRDFYEKAVFLAYMTRRLLDSVLGRRPYDDRDHYANKRLDLAGILLIKIFRENFTKLVRDIKNCISVNLNSKEITTPGASSEARNTEMKGVEQSIRKIVQNCKIESSLKYALATGDWSTGRSSTSKPSSTSVGIAQVLSRLSLPGTISYLRRLQSPLEKEGGKLVAPRRLHGSQIGRICPNETPEGQQVGVVKNLALTAKITLDHSSLSVFYILQKLHLISLKKLDFSILAYTVKVFVNGRWLGNARDTAHANQIFKNLKYYKRTRNPDLGVSWNFEFQEIHVRSDGGRYLRPLYLVKFDEQAIKDFEPDKYQTLRPNKLLIAEHWAEVKDFSWKQLLLLGAQSQGEAIIEYLDVDEEENALVAPMPDIMNRQFKDDNFTFLRYTHCEIHPALWLGVVSSVIPFSDHNQSPRNCYQCLWKETEVMMADQTLKKIKDIRVGDQVRTLDPETRQIGTAVVINQYVKTTTKRILKITFVDESELICTEDHPVLSVIGIKKTAWIKAKDLIEANHLCQEFAKLGQYCNVVYVQPGENIARGGLLIKSIEDHPNVEIADITLDREPHSFITGAGLVVHNSSMGKQAIGLYATSFNQRMDTSGTNVLCYPQRPLVNSRAAEYFGLDKAPHGEQLMVAIACFTGYNQEDSTMMNRSAIERGRFNSLHFKTNVVKINKRKASTSEVEKFGPLPSMEETKDLKGNHRDKTHQAYRYLDPATGIVRVGTKFDDLKPDEEVVIVTKYVTNKPSAGQTNAHFKYKDISMTIRPEPDSIIDKVIGPNSSIKNKDADGNEFVKVREVSLRKPEIGDKAASRSAQKGTIGMLYRQEEMPFTGNGLVPDLIMNPHAIPSRMTIAQVLECLIGKVAVQKGIAVDSTAFTNPTPETYDIDDPMKYYTEVLKDFDLHPQGEEVMYNPITGEQFEATIFFGPTYYQRLKHMVRDKLHARETGPVKTTTRQPSDGRARDGGFRLGEMERDVLISHSTALFMTERLLHSSDLFRVFVGNESETVIVGNPDKGIYRYDQQDLNPDEVTEVHLPYSMQLFRSELTAMGIDIRLLTE